MGASERKGDGWDVPAYSREEIRVLTMDRRNLSRNLVRKGWKWGYHALNEDPIPTKGRSPQPVSSRRANWTGASLLSRKDATGSTEVWSGQKIPLTKTSWQN